MKNIFTRILILLSLLHFVPTTFGGQNELEVEFTHETWSVPNSWGGTGYSWTGDFNGDGLTDIASADSGKVYMNLSTGNRFQSETWSVPNSWGGAGYSWTGDFNGDGLTDIASAYEGNVYMNLSTGNRFQSETWSVPNSWASADYTWTGDFNGDDLTDIAFAKYGDVYMNLSTGTRYVPTAAFSISTAQGEAPLTVTLDANSSTDSDGTIVEYYWSASDGQIASGKRVNMTFPNAGTYTINLVVTDDKDAQSTNTAQQTVTVTAKPVPKVAPVAHLSISPTNGEIPLTVSLNASGSSDSDGTIVDYAWTASDGQEKFGTNTKITFDKSETYTITLTVTDNDGLTATAQDTVTVSEPTTLGIAHIEFKGLKDFYQVGETLVMELVETVNRDKYTRVDLWVAIELPSRDFLFRTEIPLTPWHPNPQPHKTSIENTETSHYIFDFEVPEGIGGDYTLYAAYVKEGENPVTNGFSIRSNLVVRQIFLANRKD
jgi:PKD repeat protein